MENLNNKRFFEGCGKEGPIKGIFLCIFHLTYGPMISCQVPNDFITKETFESVSVYLIPKSQLVGSIITVTICGIKIVGFPVIIENKQNARDSFYFNLCFVCDSWARTVQYDPVVKKFSAYLRALEEENNFLSKIEENISRRERLENMLDQVMQDLNKYGVCTLTEGNTSTHLKVVKIQADPPQVLDFQVPVLIESLDSFYGDQWDLTTQQILPYIDGFNHVSKIAALADVDINLVKTCLQNLIYFFVIKMVPIFQYSNCYVVTPKIRQLAIDKKLQEQCLKSVTKSTWQLPSVRDVFRLYCGMCQGTTVSDLCLRYNPASLRIDERKLVQFGLVHNIIRKLHKYPVLLSESKGESLHQYLTGTQSYDEICCRLACPTQHLDKLIEADNNITVVYK